MTHEVVCIRVSEDFWEIVLKSGFEVEGSGSLSGLALKDKPNIGDLLLVVGAVGDTWEELTAPSQDVGKRERQHLEC